MRRTLFFVLAFTALLALSLGASSAGAASENSKLVVTEAIVYTDLVTTFDEGARGDSTPSTTGSTRPSTCSGDP